MKIPIKTKIHILIEFIFKVSFSIFIIVFFTIDKSNNLKNNDRVLIILSGFILLLLIDYIEFINIMFDLHIKNDS